MTKIKLVLIVSTFCMTIQADTWFNSLKRTLHENRLYTAMAISGTLIGSFLSTRPREGKILRDSVIKDSLGRTTGYGKELVNYTTSQSVYNIGAVSLGIGLGTLCALGYLWLENKYSKSMYKELLSLQ